ncbi:MAG: acetolactate synthase [Opitutus sp.]
MAAQIATSPNDPVKQFSVFAENRLGRLHDLTSLFKEHRVHVMGITVIDMTDSAIVRCIVDDPDQARELMINNDFPYVECDLLAVEITDESELKGVLAALFEAEINVHYVYSFIKRPEGRGGLAIKTEDDETAAQAMSKRGFRLLTQRDISR